MDGVKLTAINVFNWLDNQDNTTDEIIQKNAWDKFQSIMECKSIDNCILKENALKTISTYLRKANSSQIDLLNNLINGNNTTTAESVSVFDSQKQTSETQKNYKIDINCDIFQPQKISVIPEKIISDKNNDTPEEEQNLLYKKEIEQSVFNDEDAGICYKEIPSIRQKIERGETVSSEEQQLLKEFNEMITSICKSGEEYGIDPRLISTIIRRECRYDGIYCKNNSSVGHMQLTRIAIRDMVGDDGYGKIKTEKYGNELKDLLESRGFETSDNINKTVLAKDVFTYLKEHREDTDFNIRLGSLMLKSLLNRRNGNVQKAAEAYNGSQYKHSYGVDVAKRYKKIST